MNLAERSPRSPRVRLGGFVLLPRLLDKCRAEIAGTSGDYHYNCPLDQRFFAFTGLDHELLKAEVDKGGGDGAVLNWILANMPNKITDYQIAQWSTYREAAVPADNESRQYISDQIAASGGADRDDLGTWFDFLDFDDYVTFGGRA